LTPEQVHGAFASGLNKAYIVIEVGLFPNEQIDVNQLDFSLVPAGTQTVLRPVKAKVIASVLQKPVKHDTRRPRAPGDIEVYPTVGIGYETGSVYDPVTGRRRAGGWNTSTGVGVGIGGSRDPGPPPPASTGADRRTMEIELSEKALPEGVTTRAVAGYLYFPFAGKNRSVVYNLEYKVNGENFLLPLGRYGK
ncbi:MAG: hypothetical protein ACRD8O_18550, partial [Bryobacteraceae bacterium]